MSYEALARNSSAEDSSDLERHLFGGLKRLGARLVSDDQRRRRSFIAVEQRLEDMDERVSQIEFLSPFEGDVEEIARLVSNYAAAPSLENSERSLEELDEFVDELVEAVKAAGTKTERTGLRAVLGQTREFKQIQVRIISLMNTLKMQFRAF